MMEQEEIKRKLLGLWEKTTHNSKDLLATLFDYYFNIEYIEYKELDGKIVSAICGIPYTFGYGSQPLKGIYLLPLTSEEGFRKKGILSELLRNFNEKLKQEFDFSFLVPHTALLADYYGTLGYQSTFYTLEERFTPLHDFKNDYLLSLEESDEHIKNLKTVLFKKLRVIDNSDSRNFSVEELIDYIQNIEQKSSASVNLIHTVKDLDYVLLSNAVVNYNNFVAFDEDGKITGVAFTKKDDLKHTKVVATYVSDTCSYYVLLDFIKRHFSDHSLSVVTSDPRFQTVTLIQQTYASISPNGVDLDNTFNTVEMPFNINKLMQPEGMMKLLRVENILKYLAENRSDADFKLFLRDLEESEGYAKDDNIQRESNIHKQIIFIVKNGKLKKMEEENFGKDRSVLNLTIKELSELLLRKNDSSNLIMEAFGIPRMNFQFRLLPC